MSDEETRLEERHRPTREDPAASRMYSLVEVAQQTGIPMPILLRYKREHPERIPSAGVGSQQRFPEAAFEAFLEIQREEEAQGQDLPRRGGFGLLSLPKLRKRTSEEGPAEPAEAEPRHDQGAAPAASSAQPTGGTAEAAAGTARDNGDRDARMLKLTEISERLGIPYPTAARYASQYADRIPHEGHGRNRRFPPEALEIFRRIRRDSKPGRPPKKHKQQAEPPTPRPARATAPLRELGRAEERSAAPGTPNAGVAADLPDRIAALERAQESLADEVRRLAEEARQPVTVFARKH
ncbi:MAG: helix-turn-helix domain-containing protein [Thermoanaerobaculia bacterium]